MSYDQIYAIAFQGMNLEKLRIDVVASNIANQYSLQGGGYKPMQVETHANSFLNMIDEPLLNGVNSVKLVPQNLQPNQVYQPGHPAADDKGYVSYVGLSTIDEMTTLLKASRAYEANIKVINTAHSLYLQALTIGEER